MDNRYYNNVISEMEPFFKENGFTASEDGYFLSENKKVAVRYDDAKQMYRLFLATKEEDDSFSEEVEISSWLFDDTQNESGAVSVGMDFVNTLKKKMGIQSVRQLDGTNIDLPTASKTGTITISGFTKKMLDFFPAIKESYKASVSRYDGHFLPLDFYGEFIVPNLVTLFTTGTKKQIKNMNAILSDAYIKADKDTINLIIAMLAAAAYKNPTVTAAIKEMLATNSHFLISFETFSSVLPKKKKLMKALVRTN